VLMRCQLPVAAQGLHLVYSSSNLDHLVRAAIGGCMGETSKEWLHGVK
jgi:hypothetical protein